MMLSLKFDNIKKYLCAIFLALGPVVWFYNYSIAPFKYAIFALLCIFCSRYIFIPRNLYGFKYFVIAISILILSIIVNRNVTDLIYFWGYIENYILFVIGYNFAKDNIVDNKFIFAITFIIGAICVLTITNFLFNIPSWVSPIEMSRIYDLVLLTGNEDFTSSELYQTGFGLARTGWGNTLALFIPLCLLMIISNYRKKASVILVLSIATSVCICGSRGAIVALLITMLITSYKFRKRRFPQFMMFVLPFLLIILLWNYSDSLMEYYRLDSTDLTTGRAGQYQKIGAMVDEMGFMGLGINGTSKFLNWEGASLNIHNSYINLFLQFGWLAGLFLIIFVWKILTKLLKFISKSSSLYGIFFSLTILSGLVSCLLEPNAVFGARSWYSIWWFSLGLIFFGTKSFIKKHCLS